MFEDGPTERQVEIFKAMTPGRKLEMAFNMYRTAWELKAARLREIHPDGTDEAIEGAVREIFINGRS